MPTFDKYEFTGPVEIRELPSSPGLYLITTDASGGIKLLGVYDGGNDMKTSAEKNPKKGCWQKNRKDTDPVTYYILEDDARRRDSICRSIIDRRYYEMVCNDPPRDDF